MTVLSDRSEVAGGSGDRHADWSFARRPFWLFSHVFALLVVVLFVALGLWQLDRHDEREAANAVIERRLAAEPIVVDGVDDLAGSPEELDFRPATVNGTWVDGNVVQVINRSQGGVAGLHIVGLVELADGGLLTVNRGFLPVNDDVEPALVPAGPVELSGHLRPTVERGRFGAVDSGRGSAIPRLDTASVADRIGRPLPAVWLQLADDDPDVVTFPDPVPLPPLDAGPHLGYAGQWFIFALLGSGFYVALLWRQAHGRRGATGG